MCDDNEKVCNPPKSNFWTICCTVSFVLAILAVIFLKPGPKPPRNITRINITVIEDEELMPFQAGVGIADMTGPIVDIGFMGFASLKQRGVGIHTRQWSRAFIISTNISRIVFVSAEINIVGIALRREVVRNLKKMYGSLYSLRNVHIGATSTYSTPGGYLGDFLLDANIMGFSNEVFFAYCDGITDSIVKAHGNMRGARLYYGRTRVWNVHINRAPYAYRANPMEERSRYDSDTDNFLSQIRIVNASGGLIGVMNWFAIHANSLNFSNRLVSSDNLGYAAIQLEKALNPDSKVGEGPIVGGFFVSNAGDVSPNIHGARCSVSGDDCDNWYLECKHNEHCAPVGPADDMYLSAKMIGSGIYEGAMRILYVPREAAYEVAGHIYIVHEFVQFESSSAPYFEPIDRYWGDWEWRWTKNYHWQYSWQVVWTGCEAMIGNNYKSGTLDGPSHLENSGNLMLEALGTDLRAWTYYDNDCQYPKGIFLSTGRAKFPVPFHHRTSLFAVNLGGVFIIGVGAEPTTMAGRRLRYIAAHHAGTDQVFVIIWGHVNEYVHYITTRQEYGIQSFEGAATLYGKRTLEILMWKLVTHAQKASEGYNLNHGLEPSYFKDQAISLVYPAIADQTVQNKSFGYCLEQPRKKVATETTVFAKFVGANPRNNLMTGETHLKVEGIIKGEWEEVASDADWETKLVWERVPVSESQPNKGVSHVTVIWDVPATADYTEYRLKYIGASRDQFGALAPFEGVTNRFTVSDEGEEDKTDD